MWRGGHLPLMLNQGVFTNPKVVLKMKFMPNCAKNEFFLRK